MKHVCLNCKFQFDCPMEYCEDQSHKMCSILCKDEFEKKNDLQTSLSETLFPNGEWH